MNEQQIQAYLGQWHDIVVGRNGGGGRRGAGFRAAQMPGPGMGPGTGMGRQRHRRDRWDQWGGYGGDYGGYGGGYDQSAQLWAYIQQLQQQLQLQQQGPMPMPVPVPVPMPGAPAGSPQMAGWYDLTGPMVGAISPDAFPFQARAAVVDAPLPTQANRDILPMSTGVPILPTQSAQITGRPQVLVFKIGRFVISNAGTAGGAADWIVNDIKIGNRSQFVQSGDVPGDLFATNAIDTFVRFESAQTAMDVVVVVTYIGLNESGCPFFGAMVGTAAV